jgi:ADP-ribosylglycohydrolase
MMADIHLFSSSVGNTSWKTACTSTILYTSTKDCNTIMNMFSVDKHRLRLMVVALGSVASIAAKSLSSVAADQVQKQDRMRGAYYGALVADALSLGSHYEYSAPKIKQAYGGTIQKYMAPGEQMGGETHGIGWGARNYHPGTVAGDQTDYGEYNVLILEYLATTASNPQPYPFNVQELLPIWKNRLETNWKQWMCTQTKTAYQQVAKGVPVNQIGGPSNAMALRFAPVFSYYGDEDGVVDAARKSMFTHKEQTAHFGAEFFARVTYRIIHQSLTPLEAIEKVAAESHPWIQQKVEQALTKAQEATDPKQPLSTEEFVDDLALTSMARLWDVGKRYVSICHKMEVGSDRIGLD